MKDILVVGCGAVGAVYSHILKRGGSRVTAVARSNYSAIKNEGITFNSVRFGDVRGWKPDRLCPSVESAADRPYSCVVLATKCIPELRRTPDLLAPLLAKEYIERHSQPTYVLLQNGLGVEADLWNASKPNIISTALYIGTNLLSPNHVSHTFLERVYLGMYRHNDYTTTTYSPSEQTILSEFANLLQTGGSVAHVVPEVQRIKFRKNLWNIAFSSVSSLTRYTLPAIFRKPPSEPGQNYSPYVWPTTSHLIDEYTFETIRGLLREVVALGHAMGFEDNEKGLPSSAVEAMVQDARAPAEKPDSTFKASMLLDIEKLQPIEVEVIVGEVVRLARRFNVDVPRVEMLYALLLVIQNQILRENATKK